MLLGKRSGKTCEGLGKSSGRGDQSISHLNSLVNKHIYLSLSFGKISQRLQKVKKLLKNRVNRNIISRL